MIVNYPMLVSDTISPGIIPGICKIVERYILIHEVDSITDSVQQKITRAFVFTGHAFTIATAAYAGKEFLKKKFGESENVLEYDPPEVHNAHVIKVDQNIVRVKGGDPSGGGTSSRFKGGQEAPERKKDIKATKFNISLGNADAISLEPTWVQIDAGEMGTKVIGVKVIPFPIKTDGNTISLLLNDSKVSLIKSMMTAMSRKAIRLFFAFSRGIKMPFIKDKFLSGDIKKDVIWASSKYGSRTFVLLNYAELQDNEFLKDMGGFAKLQKLGWGSVMMADDINRRAMFCMKEFKGSCSVLPYQYIYAGLGKSGQTYTKVYDDMEDVRKSSSPFFKLKKNRKTLMGEAYGLSKLDKYKKSCKEK